MGVQKACAYDFRGGGVPTQPPGADNRESRENTATLKTSLVSGGVKYSNLDFAMYNQSFSSQMAAAPTHWLLDVFPTVGEERLQDLITKFTKNGITSKDIFTMLQEKGVTFFF